VDCGRTSSTASSDRVLGTSLVRRKARAEANSFQPKLDNRQDSGPTARLQATRAECGLDKREQRLPNGLRTRTAALPALHDTPLSKKEFSASAALWRPQADAGSRQVQSARRRPLLGSVPCRPLSRMLAAISSTRFCSRLDRRLRVNFCEKHLRGCRALGIAPRARSRPSRHETARRLQPCRSQRGLLVTRWAS
jgi:hypothetical protein